MKTGVSRLSALRLFDWVLWAWNSETLITLGCVLWLFGYFTKCKSLPLAVFLSNILVIRENWLCTLIWKASQYSLLHIICQALVLTFVFASFITIFFFFIRLLWNLSIFGCILGSFWSVNSFSWGFFWINDFIEYLASVVWVVSFYRYHTFFYVSPVKRCFFATFGLLCLVWHLMLGLFFSQHFSDVSHCSNILYFFFFLFLQKNLYLLCYFSLNSDFFYLLLFVNIFIIFRLGIYWAFWCDLKHTLLINVICCFVIVICYFSVLNIESMWVHRITSWMSNITLSVRFVTFCKAHLNQNYFISFFRNAESTFVEAVWLSYAVFKFVAVWFLYLVS
jgi:hypothetical protein